jgi:hypothetical protein
VSHEELCSELGEVENRLEGVFNRLPGFDSRSVGKDAQEMTNTSASVDGHKVTVCLPPALAEVWQQRCAAYGWNSDRIMGSALLYFLEHAGPRASMFQRLLEVEAGDVVRVSDEDVLEGHIDACFEIIEGDLQDGWYATQQSLDDRS